MDLNTIICGDAFAELKKLSDKSIDVIITDPVWPNTLSSLAGADDPYGLFARSAVQMVRVAKRIVVHLGCTSDPRFLAIPKEMPFIRVVWLRYSFPSKRGRILIGSDVAYAFGEVPASRKGNHLLKGEVGLKHDEFMTINIEKREHPVPRKIEHVKALVSIFSNPGEIICDPFLGSGTTAVAAKMLGRNFIGIEIEEKYCAIARRRVGSVTPQMF